MPERYYRELIAYVSRHVGDRDRAADVVQEAYARVFAAQTAVTESNGMEIREPRAFLYQTARNIVIDHHRRTVVRDVEELDRLDAPVVAAPEHEQPEVRLSQKQSATRLLNAIQALPPRCREAFMLFKFDGLPQAEIALRMGISRNMVEKHVIAGMVACKRALED